MLALLLRPIPLSHHIILPNGHRNARAFCETDRIHIIQDGAMGSSVLTSSKTEQRGEMRLKSKAASKLYVK